MKGEGREREIEKARKNGYSIRDNRALTGLKRGSIVCLVVSG
jgi:hypothetical protein